MIWIIVGGAVLGAVGVGFVAHHFTHRPDMRAEQKQGDRIVRERREAGL